ncbi:MAG: sigma-70 family RNA polymerase sigma factor [Alphaproteobacteria bacterium]
MAKGSDMTAPLDDPEFHARIRAGDRTAIKSVVESYLGQILRAARGAGLDPHQADDVTQATFTAFIEAAPRFEGRSSVRTWLFGILYKKIAEARRARDRDRQMDDIDEVFERRFDATGKWSRPPLPVDVDLHNKDVQREIFACLDAAPLRQTLAFLLREVEELSTNDICDILGVTNTNLGVMLYRVRNRVRECLEA